MSLHTKVQKALEQDNSIIIREEDLTKSNGFSLAYFELIGLTSSTLKKLERKGLAKRGYTKNEWLPGETLPNGKVVPEGNKYVGKGRRTRWFLIVPKLLGE